MTSASRPTTTDVDMDAADGGQAQESVPASIQAVCVVEQFFHNGFFVL